MRWRRFAVILLVPALAGCSSDSTTRSQVLPVNPSPLAHLTYDCAILDGTTRTSTPEALFYLEPFDDGGSGQSRMCALDWDGKFVRQLERGLAVQQSADGSRLLAVDYPVSGTGSTPYVIVDDGDHVLERLSTIWNGEAIWADDNRRLCYIQDSNPLGQGGLAYLVLQLPGSAARRVATVGGINYSAPPRSNGPVVPIPFMAGPHLLACSASADRAAVLDPAKGTVALWRLSDGLELRTHAFGHPFYPFQNPAGSERLVASSDGRYVADDVEGADGVPVIDLVTDSVAAHLVAKSVAGFSSDSTRAVLQLNTQVVEVMDWRSGRVLKQLAGTYPYVFSRPASQVVLVGVPSTRRQFGLDLYIVRDDGSAFEVARSVEVIGR